MPNCISIVVTAAVLVAVGIVVWDPPRRVDCDSSLEILDRWVAEMGPTMKQEISLLNSNSSDLDRACLVDRCAPHVNGFLSENEIQDWKLNRKFGNHYVKYVLAELCSLYSELESLQNLKQPICFSRLKSEVENLIPRKLEELQVWLKVWRLCQVDNHHELCRLSVKFKFIN